MSNYIHIPIDFINPQQLEGLEDIYPILVINILTSFSFFSNSNNFKRSKPLNQEQFNYFYKLSLIDKDLAIYYVNSL